MAAKLDAVALENVTVSAGSRQLLAGVSLTVAPGEAVSIVGRSGAGKTTLLRLMNGLVRAGSGRVLRDGVELRDDQIVALRRMTGYMPQAAALFPHRSVFDNIATVPRLKNWQPAEIEREAKQWLERLSLDWSRDARRFPRSLSGGEQQRVAIARALIARPTLLLCDEPFSALDPIVRREQQLLLRALHREQQTTIVFVTHDIVEALRIGERVILIDEGQIVVDAPSDEFRRSGHPLAQSFLEGASIA